MLQTESEVVVADNTGAKIAKVIRVLKWSSGDKAVIGDRVVVAIQTVAPSSTFKKGDVSRAIVVRTKKWVRRTDGTYVKFADNAVALINKDNEPLGKRIFGPVAKELRDVGFKEVATLAEEVI